MAANNLLDLSKGELLNHLIEDDKDELPATTPEAIEGGEEEEPRRGRTHMTLQPNYDKAKWQGANPKQFLIIAHRILDSTRVFQLAIRSYSGRSRKPKQLVGSSKGSKGKEELLAKGQGTASSRSIYKRQRLEKGAEANQLGHEESKHSGAIQTEGERAEEEALVPATLESASSKTEPQKGKRNYVLEFPDTKALVVPQFISVWWLKRDMVVETIDVLPSLFRLELDLSIKMLHRTLQEFMREHDQLVSVAPKVA